MKRKILMLLLTSACICAGAIGIAGCNFFAGEGGNENDADDFYPMHTHVWSESYFEEDDRHYQTCSGCEEKLYNDHLYENGICVFCNHCCEVVIKHKHGWLEVYYDDGDKHYQSCYDTECDEKLYSYHTYVDSYCIYCRKMQTTNGLEYTLNDDGESYSVTGIGTAKSTEIVIPDLYKTKPVTKIGAKAFQNCSSLTSVIVPEGVTEIGDYGFYGCNAIKYFTIPESVTFIGDYAFCDCNSIQYITIPDNVKNICRSAFSNCTSLKSLTIGENVTTIGNNAFENCTSLSTINFNAKACEDFNTINNVFSCAGKFTGNLSLHVGTNVTKIPAYLFYLPYSTTASSLLSVDFANDSKCESIGAYAFSWCTSLIYLTIGENVKTIYNSAFTYTALVNVTIPDNVTSIGQYAFNSCTSLKCLTIGKSVSDIGSQAFTSCISLTEINFNAKNCNALSIGTFSSAGNSSGGTKVNIGKSVISIPDNLFACSLDSYYSAKITDVTFVSGNRCESIGTKAFFGCSSLTSIIIIGTITSIGSSAFGGCSLTNLSTSVVNTVYTSKNNCLLSKDGSVLYLGCKSSEIPSSVTTIDTGAFYYCNSLTNITIPNTVTAIGEEAFSYCTSLKRLTIGENVSTIGKSAFNNCTSLTEINFNAKACEDFDSQHNLFSMAGNSGSGITLNIGVNVTKIPACLFVHQSLSGDYTYYAAKIAAVKFADNSKCEKIGKCAFYYCTSLKSISIPNSVNTLGVGAFQGCSALTSVTIPDSVTSIEEYAFHLCGLTSVSIPNSSVSIGYAAFANCYSLTSATIPNSITYLDWGAFALSNSLERIIFEGTTEQWNALCKNSGWSTSSNGHKIYCTNGTIE